MSIELSNSSFYSSKSIRNKLNFAEKAYKCINKLKVSYLVFKNHAENIKSLYLIIFTK